MTTASAEKSKVLSIPLNAFPESAAHAGGVRCVSVANGYFLGLVEALTAGSKRISNWLELLDLAA